MSNQNEIAMFKMQVDIAMQDIFCPNTPTPSPSLEILDTAPRVLVHLLFWTT